MSILFAILPRCWYLFDVCIVQKVVYLFVCVGGGGLLFKYITSHLSIAWYLTISFFFPPLFIPSHYKTTFETRDGVLRWSDIDKEYNISFVFKGNFKRHLIDDNGQRMKECYTPPVTATTTRVAKKGVEDKTKTTSTSSNSKSSGTLRGRNQSRKPSINSKKPIVNIRPPSPAPPPNAGIADYFLNLSNLSYQLEIEEDPNANNEKSKPYGFMSGVPQGVLGGRSTLTGGLANAAGNSASASNGGKTIAGNNMTKLLTDELRGLSGKELRDGGEDYKLLLEARELEDLLFSGR